jgi:hypothetical protein
MRPIWSLPKALSKHSRLGQRNDRPLAVQVSDRLVNGTIEVVDAGECRPARVDRRRTLPMLWQGRGASAPRSRRHKAERCRRLWPAARAVADASRSDRPRWQLAALSGCAAAAGNGTFFRNALDSCERLMLIPSRASISARMRAIVQFGRLATGSSSNGVTTRKAVSLFTGGGPGATLAFSASMPPPLKSLRHSRTVSSRTLNASAMRPATDRAYAQPRP